MSSMFAIDKPAERYHTNLPIFELYIPSLCSIICSPSNAHALVIQHTHGPSAEISRCREISVTHSASLSSFRECLPTHPSVPLFTSNLNAMKSSTREGKSDEVERDAIQREIKSYIPSKPSCAIARDRLSYLASPNVRLEATMLPGVYLNWCGLSLVGLSCPLLGAKDCSAECGSAKVEGG